MRNPSWILFLLVGLAASYWLSLAQFTRPAPTVLPLQASPDQPAVVTSCPANTQIPGTEFCSHGPDPAPGGYTIDRQVQPLLNTRAEPASVICDGDGVSGKRIQVLYVRTVAAPDRYQEFLPSIRTWVAEVDGAIAASAVLTGGIRHLRFVTNPACQVDVAAVEIPTGAEESFGQLIDSLIELGYSRADRKYLLFVDAKVYCGTGTILYDSQPGPANQNNTKSGYARVDSGCWGLKPLLHELIHTLGGVQHDAPHSTHGWHCTDEYDVMCYSDWPHHPAVTVLCPETANESRLDCNHDDYFHTDPPADSYLASHWNVANSEFLITRAGPTSPPAVTLLTDPAEPTLIAPATIRLTAQAVDLDGQVQRVEFYHESTLLSTIITPTYTYSTLLSTVVTSTYTYTWSNVPTGIYSLYAKAYDQVGASQTSAPIPLTVTDAAGLINGARGKAAIQASTALDRAAARAVDGITSEEQAGGTTAQTMVQYQPWWQVDLGADIPVAELHLWGNPLCCSDGTVELEVLVAPTPILTQSLASAVLQPGVAHYHLTGQPGNPLKLVMEPGQSGRYVGIGAVTTTALALAEVEVMVHPDDLPVSGQGGLEDRLYLPLVASLSP